jgi:integrase
MTLAHGSVPERKTLTERRNWLGKRRGSGEGSIFQRADGIWTAEVTLPRGSDGKRRRKTIYGRTRREVAGKLQQLQSTILADGLVEPSKENVAQYLARWLRDSVAHTVRPVTLESYTRYVRLHAVPALGNLALAKLSPAHLQQLYSDRLSAGLSRRTVQYLHAILHRALEQAVRWQLINRNPADAVDAPRPARPPIRVLTPAEVEQLVRALDGDPLRLLYYLAVATGCRRGELVALRWQDIDWNRPALLINRTAEEVGGQVIWTEPKTARSRRAVPLPEPALAALIAHRQTADPHCELLFSRPGGLPVSPGHVSQHFAVILKRAGLPRVRLHDLRHTHATMLLAADVHPKVVAERLGHSTITLTLDTYSHVLPTMQDEVTKKLNAILPAGPGA